MIEIKRDQNRRGAISLIIDGEIRRSFYWYQSEGSDDNFEAMANICQAAYNQGRIDEAQKIVEMGKEINQQINGGENGN